ncbi:MAG: hypothetical protein HKN85_12135, partial [Gammaproteobacteria bacterium]|nr:hypothetical protein [Gammaproteobacteria bacterium]
GGQRTKTADGYVYDEKAMYKPMGLPDEAVLSVDAIREMDFDLLFSAHTKLISPRSARKRIQIFHGISFRNKAVRPENMGCDHYFVVGPYMLSRFESVGLLKANDPRVVKVGFMKTDALINGSLDRQATLTGCGLKGERPVILYAPTGAKQNSLETVGEEAIRNLLEADQYELLIKPHDHPKNTDIDWASYLKRYESDNCRVIAPHEDVIPYLHCADLLISDASSVVNEYSLLDRPVVFLDTPDLLEAARTANHSMLDLDTWGRDGGLVASQPSDVARVVEQSLADPKQLSSVRQKMARDLFFNPGHATDAAMQWLAEQVLPALDQKKRAGHR